MPDEILLIGLGQAGASIGLALKDDQNRITRVGYDRDRVRADMARASDAVDRVAPDLPKAAATASLVIISLHPSQLKEHLRKISAHLRPGVSVLETSPLKTLAMSWGHEFLHSENPMIGAVPIPGPEALDLDTVARTESPNAAFYQGGLLALVVPAGAPKQALNEALWLAQTLEASPLFIEANELDSMFAAIDSLPRLLGLAFMNLLAGQSSWREMQKMIDRSFAFSTAAFAERSPERLASEFALNKDLLLVRLDSLLEEFQRLRAQLASGDSEALAENTRRAEAAREAWLQSRSQPDSED